MRAGFSALVAIVGALLGPASEPVAAEEKGFFERETLTGDWGGARKELLDAGVELGLNDLAETLSNPTGGIRQLTIYQGLVAGSLKLDLEKIAAWPGASFYVDGYQISGRGLSRNAIGNLLFVSSIEALASVRLHDLWLQQEFLNHKVSMRVGQIAFDDE
ncbi:MAG TPA: carbohydrate porin, partial [Bradyrhizobium sp.]|nr:carbohydrate porin [Bradyrhizobium sp.]